MDTGSKRPNKIERNGIILHKEQVRKVLKSIEMEGIPASDDIASSPSVYKMTVTIATSDGIVSDAIRAQTNEASEKTFDEYMGLPLRSDAHEYGHDELRPDWWEEPAAFFSEFPCARHLYSRIHNDGGLSL